jgi:hypothetical protein
MADEFVIYNGVRMIKGWPEKIRAAQSVTTIKIYGREHDRTRYGHEEGGWGANARPCHDCGVVKDQFHVPGCDVERCPACGGQMISCDCEKTDER